MRMPEAGPLGEAFFEASALAMAEALWLKRPSSGWVESVSTFADHFFVAIFVSEVCFDRICWMRVLKLLASPLEKKVGEHLAALFGEEAGCDFDFVVELRVIHDGEDRATGSGFGVGRGVDEAGDAGVEDRSSAHGAGFERGVESTVFETIVCECASRFAEGYD